MEKLRRTMLYVPGNNAGMVKDAHIYRSDSSGKLIHHHDIRLCLKYLKGLRHVGCTRDSRHKTLGFRVLCAPIGEILGSLIQRTLLVGNLAAMDNALP